MKKLLVVAFILTLVSGAVSAQQASGESFRRQHQDGTETVNKAIPKCAGRINVMAITGWKGEETSVTEKFQGMNGIEYTGCIAMNGVSRIGTDTIITD